MKYRIIKTSIIFNANTGSWEQLIEVIKDGFTTKVEAEKWNARHRNPRYIIESYA